MQVPRAAIALAVSALTVIAGTAAFASTGNGSTPGAQGPKGTPIPADGPAGPAASIPAAAQSAPVSRATVTLVTGDRVSLETASDGSQSASLLAPSGGDAPADATFTGFSWRGDQYLVPASVAPFVSSTLDLRLFDVSYLVRAKLDDAHSSTLPVKITYGAGRGAGVAALPGVHVPAASGAASTGTVDKKQARAFGKQLAAQWKASRTGASTAKVGTLPGVTRIELAPPAAAPALPEAPGTSSMRPQAGGGSGPRFHTLTIDSIDLDGNPGTALGFIQNVDDWQLTPGAVLPYFLAFPGQQGPVSVSVPEGTYSLQISVMTGPSTDLTARSALVVKPEVTVRSDTKVTLDARTAKPYQVSFDTPVTSEWQVDIMTFTRASAVGGQNRVQAFGVDGLLYMSSMHLWSQPDTVATLYATPTSPVTKGAFDFDIFSQFVNGSTSAEPRYFVNLPSRGRVPDSLDYTVRKADMAAVHQKIYASACATCEQPQNVFYETYLPWAQNRMNAGALVLPGDHTDYLYSSVPELTVWQTAFNVFTGPSEVVRRYGPRRTVSPAERIDEEWNKAPQVPPAVAPFLQTPTFAFVGTKATQVTDPRLAVCVACRQDDNGMLYLQAMGDSDGAHFADPGELRSYGTAVDFYRDGQLVRSSVTDTVSPFVPFGIALPMGPDAATYRLDWNTGIQGDRAGKVDTDWTFRSARDDAAASLPDSVLCGPDTSQRCSFLPLLFLRYDLELDFGSKAKAGAPFTVDFTVSGQEHAPAPAGLAATVELSYDDGQTWTAAQDAHAEDNGRFTVGITHPDLESTNGFVSLRVKAHDNAGNSVTQTLVRAYGLTR